jgi:hypothetical protein
VRIRFKKNAFATRLVLLTLGITLLLSVGAVAAGDGSATTTKLQAKLAAQVQAGQLTQEQADARIAGRTVAHAKGVAKVEAKLAKLVESGTLSQDEADAKAWECLKRPRGASKHKAKLAKLVEAGTLSQDQADTKLKKHLKKTRPMVLYKAKLAKLVESGTLSQAEADTKLASIEAKKDKRAKKKAERKGS